MGSVIQSVLTFLWRLISPLVIYDCISEVVYVFLMLCFVRYDALLFTTAGAVFSIVPLALIYRNWCEKERAAGAGGLTARSFTVSDAFAMAGLGMCLCVFFNILVLYLPFSWEEYDAVGEVIYRTPVFFQLICVGVIVPTAEELVFRGLGYRRIRAMMPVLPAVLFSSLFFGAFHGNLIQGVYAGILGVFMAGVMEWYGTLAASYVLHAAANMMSVFLTNTLISSLIAGSPVFRAAALIVSGVLAAFLVTQIRKEDFKI